MLWLIRIFVYIGLAVTAVAYSLAQLMPPLPRSGNSQPSVIAVINGKVVNPGDRRLFCLDPRTGQLDHVWTSTDEALDEASFAPWRDAEGRLQLVGRWVQMKDHGTVGAQLLAVGLARLTFPGGEVLDRIETDIIPAGPPCWSPMNDSKLLFGGTDGRLYFFQFEDPAEGEPKVSVKDRKPKPVPWRLEEPGAEDVFFQGGIAWPRDPRLGGRFVVAALSRKRPDRQQMLPSQLWWLRLDEAGLAIEAAGRLTSKAVEESEDTAATECHPSVMAVPGGKLLLGYLVRKPGWPRWRLRVAELTTDTPAVELLAAPVGLVADVPCLPVAPVFALDGSAIFCLEPSGSGTPLLRRHALPSASDAPAPFAEHHGGPRMVTEVPPKADSVKHTL